MGWAKISEDFYDAPEVLRLVADRNGMAALGVWTLCLSWASKHGTDVVPRALLKQLRADEKHADALVRAGFWSVNDDGWAFVPSDYLYLRGKGSRKPIGKRVSWYISKARRQRIFERDGFRCVNCGATEDLTLDHKVPRSRGGGHSDSNLQTMCRPCNSRKGAKV